MFIVQLIRLRDNKNIGLQKKEKTKTQKHK